VVHVKRGTENGVAMNPTAAGGKKASEIVETL